SQGSTPKARHVLPLGKTKHPEVTEGAYLAASNPHPAGMGTVFHNANTALLRQLDYALNRAWLTEEVRGDDGACPGRKPWRNVLRTGIVRLRVYIAKHGLIPQDFGHHGDDRKGQSWEDDFCPWS